MVLGVFRASALTFANDYFSHQFSHSALRVFRQSVNGALGIGSMLALIYYLLFTLHTSWSKSRARAVASTFYGTLMILAAVGGAVLASRVVRPAQLPFFCRDAQAFWIYLTRAILARCEPLCHAPLMAAFGFVLLIVSSLIFLVVFRRREAAHFWGTLFSSKRSVMHFLWGLIAFGAVVFNFSSFWLRPAHISNLPNVLLISVDTLRTDALGCYGQGAETPHIDSLAHRGAVFTNFYATSPWTLPSHGSMMTSRLPGELGLVSVRSRLGPGTITLAENFERYGYRTGAFVNHLFLSKAYGFDQGFATYRYFESVPPSHGLGRRASRWIDKSNEPWFCFVHLFDPHWPYAPVSKNEETTWDFANRRLLFERGDYYRFLEATQEASPGAVLRLIRAYRDDVETADAQVGVLIEYLERTMQFNNTLVLVTSDHGEAFGEHGAFGHGYLLDQDVIRVPLVLSYPPKIAAGQVVRVLGDLRDIPKTVLTLTGVPVDQEFGGRNLDPGRDVYGQEHRPVIVQTALTASPATAVVMDGLKYITPLTASYRDLNFSREACLFNLLVDPVEQENRLHHDSFMDHHFKQIVAECPTGLDRESLEIELSLTQQEQLKTAGYLQ